MIKINNLYLAYNKEYDALSNINIHILTGERVALLGDSESGKTTIIRTIAGLEPYYKGEIYVGDQNLKKINVGKCFSVAYINKKGVFFDNKSVYENLKYVLHIRKVDKVTIDKKIADTLSELGISNLQDILIKNLSDYNKLLVQLARINLRKCDIYLIDDIFSNLDSKQLKTVQKIIKKWQENETATFIICSHDTNYIPDLYTRIIKLKLGSIVEK